MRAFPLVTVMVPNITCSSGALPQLPEDIQFIDEENEAQRLGALPKDSAYPVGK